jgi:hypothetical protein
VIASLVYRPLVYERNLGNLLRAAYLLAARALLRLPLPGALRPAAAAAFVGVFLLQLVVGKEYYRRPTKQQFREAVEYVVERAPSYPGSVVASTGGRNRYLDYYLIKYGSSQRALSLNTDAAVRRLLAGGEVRFVWFVHSPGLGTVDPDLLVHNGLQVVEQQHFHKVTVRLFAVPAPPPDLPGA